MTDITWATALPLAFMAVAYTPLTLPTIRLV